MSNRFVLPIQSVFDSSGNPLSGATLDFYVSGTTTRLDTYSDSALTVANSNPVVADSSGRFGAIYLKPQAYKVVLKDSGGSTIWTEDPVICANISAFGATLADDADAATARATLGAMASPMTTDGDMIIQSAGAPARVPLNTALSNGVLHYDGSNVAWTSLATSDLPSGFLRGYIDGLILSNNATDAVNDIDIGPGVCRDDQDTNFMGQTTIQTRAIDATFVEGGPGYRDSADNLTGAKWFHVYAIGGSGKTDDFFASTSLSPTLPTGFTYKRRIGAIRWSGTTIIQFLQVGDTFLWQTISTLDINDTALSTTRKTYTLTNIPSGFRVQAILNAYTTAGSVIILPPDAADQAPSTTAQPLFTTANLTGTAFAAAQNFYVLTNTSAQITARADTTVTLRAAVVGWVDFRGKNA